MDKKLVKKASAIVLSFLLSVSGVSVTAEETPAPFGESELVTETTNEQTEGESNEGTEISEESNRESETPAETPSSEETPSTEPTVTPTTEPSAEPTAEPTSEPTAEPIEVSVEEEEDTEGEDEEEEKKDDNLAEETVSEEEKEAETEEEPSLKIYYAEDAADYAAAVAELNDDASVRLLASTNQDLRTVINFGRGVFYDGIYILEFENEEQRDEAEEHISNALSEGGNVVVDDTMGISTLTEELDENTTEEAPVESEGTNESAPAENAEQEVSDTNDEPAVEPIVINEENLQNAQYALSLSESVKTDVSTIALIDTGANGNADAYVNLTSDSDDDILGHGTLMANIIREVAGDKASIISIKAFNDDGTGSIATITAAVRYAIEADVDIINISASVRDSEKTVEFKAAIKDAVSHGITVVAAAGNNGRDASEYTPANIPEVNTIGAAFAIDKASLFSATSFSNYGECVDYWYIADSTSEAAANETGVLAAGIQDLGWDATNTWYRFTVVACQDGGANTSPFKEYEAGSTEFFTIAKCVDPPGSGNVSVDRQGPMVDGVYPNSTFWWNGRQVYCSNSSLLADYCATYSYNMSSSVSYTTENYAWDSDEYFEYGGTEEWHTPSLDRDNINPYTPGVTYAFTNTSGNVNLEGDGYYVKSKTSDGHIGEKDIKTEISGNTLYVTIDADAKDMPDNIHITLATDKKQIGSCTVTFKDEYDAGGTLTAGPDDQPFDVPGTWELLDHTVENSDCEETHLYDEVSLELHIIRGGVALKKDDIDRVTYDYLDQNAQGMATLKGAEFTVTNIKTGEAVAKIETDENGELETVTFKKNGAGSHAGNSIPLYEDDTKTRSRFFKWGDYRINETRPPEGYKRNEEWVKTFLVREEGVVYNVTPNGHEDSVWETPVRGGIELTKFDTERYKVDGNNDDPNTAQGDASLENAVFGIYNASTGIDGNDGEVIVNGKCYKKDALIMKVNTDHNGHWQSANDTFPYGWYRIKELVSPEGYNVNDGWEVTVWVGHNQADKVYWKAIDLEGKDYVVSKREDAGRTNHDYVYDGVNKSGTGIVTSDFMVDDVIRGGVRFTKIDLEKANFDMGNEGLPQGDATLAGAHIAIINDSTEDVCVNGQYYEPGETVFELVTDKNGTVESADDLLPYGTYHAIETQAPVGYRINHDWRVDFEIREDKVILGFDGEGEEDTRIPDQIIRGDVMIYKFDLESDAAIQAISDDYSRDANKASQAIGGSGHSATESNLANIQLDIYNRSLNSVLFNDNGTSKEIAPGEKVTSIWTYYDSEIGAYVAKTEEKALSYGTYSIKEVNLKENTNRNARHIRMGEAELQDSANDAYRFTDGTERYFQIGNHSYGPLSLEDYDETAAGDTVLITQGSSVNSLNFTTNLQVADYSRNAEQLLTYTTYNETTGRAETNHVFDQWNRSGSGTNVRNPMDDLNEKDGTVLQKTGNAQLDKTMIFKNQVKRNEVGFKKQIAIDNTGIETLWVLTNNTSGERHVVYTDENGEFSSTRYPHSQKTNANDKFLAMIDAKYVIDMKAWAENVDSMGENAQGEIVIDYGIWFSEGENGVQAEVDDKLGALPYGVYTLEEVPCTTNEGLIMQKFTFKVEQDNQMIHVNPYDLGTKLNYGIIMESLLTKDDGEGKTAEADSGTITLVDVVSWQGVRDADFGSYKLVGKLINGETGAVLTDADGNEITSEQIVTIEHDQGIFPNQEFTFDTEGFSGIKVVAYEYLYALDADGNVVAQAAATH